MKKIDNNIYPMITIEYIEIIRNKRRVK